MNKPTAYASGTPGNNAAEDPQLPHVLRFFRRSLDPLGFLFDHEGTTTRAGEAVGPTPAISRDSLSNSRLEN